MSRVFECPTIRMGESGETQAAQRDSQTEYAGRHEDLDSCEFPGHLKKEKPLWTSDDGRFKITNRWNFISNGDGQKLAIDIASESSDWKSDCGCTDELIGLMGVCPLSGDRFVAATVGGQYAIIDAKEKTVSTILRINHGERGERVFGLKCEGDSFSFFTFPAPPAPGCI